MHRAPHLSICLFLSCLFPLHAATFVSGVSDQSRNAAGTTATVEVTSEAGFTTTALHNDAPFPLDTPTVIAETGYHEIVETRSPDGGGAAMVSTFQFIIRSPGRAATEDGLPLFTPYPIVNDAPSAFSHTQVQLIAPPVYPQGMQIPVVAKLIDPATDEVVWLNGEGTSTRHVNAPMRLLRGWGSASGTPPRRTGGSRRSSSAPCA